MRRQWIEEGLTVEGEFRELPAHEPVQDRPPLPDVVLADSGPNQPEPVRAPRVPDDPPKFAPRTNRPGMQGAFRPTRHRKVDGIETEYVDELGPGGDSRPPF